ncbi:hypothetical protein [Pseudomonas sp. VI4.1]|uniref:hypothetical protein n=1 Tax=Pseudomonas sp. VI4.1 TaxID=1941346 RepID=UPI0009CCEE24|nr:hypothetical protein [Pseudomonas sp. VI4.1]OPK11779.1 hypothetical protein BZ163_02135 [Pseudomonas sp. VI4.1]
MTTPIVFINGLATVRCGGGFVCEEVGMFNIDVDWSDVFAGKPAPTGVQLRTVPCRSWLASEEAGKFDIDVDWSDVFAGKPAPTGGPWLHLELALMSLKLTLT